MTNWMLAALTAAALAFPAAASEQLAKITLESPDRELVDPIIISAETVTFYRQAGLTVLTGNAVVERGSIRILADFMEVHSAVDRIAEVNKVVASGNLSVRTNGSTATADSGVYDVVAQKIELSGNVKLQSGGNNFVGARFVYDLATGASSLTGRPTGTITTGN